VRNRSSSAMGASFEGTLDMSFWLIVDVLLKSVEISENRLDDGCEFKID
jgi:hypothetical protein